MSNSQIKIDKLMDEARQIRDELAVQANLGVAEAQDELSKVNDQYELFKEKSKKIFSLADDSAEELKAAAELGIKAESKEDVMTALELAAEEIKESYTKITKLF